MRICLIFNPQAGTAERIKDFLLHLTSDYRCELRPTSREHGASAIASEAAQEGFDRIVVAGGDGSVNEAINGIAPHFDAVELGVLPFGTGNDLARSLGILPEDMEAACRFAFGPHVAAIDVVKVSSDHGKSYCVNAANGGVGGRVSIDVRAEDKQRWGPMAYWMTSLSRLIDLQEFSVSMQLDDHTMDFTTLGLAVANGRYVGGGFPIAPRALLNDGLLDVTVLPVLPMFELMAAGLNFTLGREHRDARVQHYRARRVRIHAEPDMPFSIDGETVVRMDATFEALPLALRVVVGRDAPGLNPVLPDGSLIV